MNDAPKKRLQLMPEVLPAPTRAQTTTNVRIRTLTHMQRLLATAAALPMAGACTKTDTQGSQSVTIPSASASTPATQSTTEGSLLPPPKDTASAKPTVTAPDMGYAVVDPMPAPALCRGLATATTTTAVFKKDAGGLYLELTATLPTGPTWTGTTFVAGQTPSPWAGTIVSSQVTANKATLKMRPTASSQNIGVQLSISCSAGAGSIAFNATFPASPNESTKPTIQKFDY